MVIYIYTYGWLTHWLLISLISYMPLKKKNVYVLYNHCPDIWVFEKYIMII